MASPRDQFMLFEAEYLDPFKIDEQLSSMIGPEIAGYLKFPELFAYSPMQSQQDQFLYGLSNTLFKFEPRQVSSCFNSGKLYFFSMILLL